MTLRHIKIFLSVCNNECNTTKAAADLCMTQPAVSLAIKELEQYYGITLFDRIGRRLQITEAGNHFKEYAGHINYLFDNMEMSMKNWDTFGTIRVGASITIGSQFLPDYVKAFNSMYPQTEVQVIVGPSEMLEQHILDNKLDFALIEGHIHSQSLVSTPYLEDHLTVICPANEMFFQGQEITIEEFKKQKFLLRERGSGARETFDRVVEEAGFSITPTWEAMSTTALVNGVINGLGISVLPQRMVMGSLQRGVVISVNVKDLKFSRRFHVIYHKEKYLTKSAKRFIELCKSYEIDYPMPNYNNL